MLTICMFGNAAPTIDKIETNASNIVNSVGKAPDEVSILGVDSTAFPKISAKVFVGCDSDGKLQKEDFSLKENGSNVIIDNIFFTGRASGQSVDLAVVFDDTGSMSDEIEAMKSKVQDLIDRIAGSGLDARYALVSFKDHESLRSTWTKDTTSFKTTVNYLYSSSPYGDDEPENALDAIETTLDLGFRPEAQKVVLVITDAPAHLYGDGTTFTDRTGDLVKADLLRSGAILIVVSPKFPSSVGPLDLKTLVDEVGGTWIDIASADFTNILDHIATMITSTYVLEYASPDLTQNTPRYVEVSVRNSSCSPDPAASEYALPVGSKSLQPNNVGIYNLSYSGAGIGDNAYGKIYENYNVEVSKYIAAPEPGDPGCQNVVICVKTPKIDFKPVTVFALDSSGSMEQSGYTAPMITGIGNALLSHPGIEYARVDWDALLGTRSIDPVTGMSPNPRLSDIDYSGKFRLANTWTNEVSLLQGRWGRLQFSEEPEGTDYYVGLKEALDKIKARKAIATHPFLKQTTAWQVVFVAGKSEFSRGDINSLIKDALANGINISTIGIDIGPGNPKTGEEAQALEDMVAGTLGDRSKDLNLDVPNDARAIEGITDGILKYHVAKLYSTPVIKNVIVTETLYSYLDVLGSTPMYYNRQDNPDGTTTLYFRLPDLLQNNQSCIKIYTELNFDKLPVDVSSNKNKPNLDFRAAETTPPSVVSYETDMASERTGKIPLPEGGLSIGCVKPSSPIMSSSAVVGNNTKPSEAEGPVGKSTPKTPGFEVAFTAVGIMVAYLLRRW